MAEAGDYIRQVQGEEVRAMLALIGVVAVLLIAAFTVSFLAVLFSDEISAYLKAKTEELKAMTEIIREDREEND